MLYLTILTNLNISTMSYVSALYHLVFTTYLREPVINNDYRRRLYAIIASEIKSLKSKALIINGVQDHIHILLSLHQTVALSELVRHIKSKSSIWAKSSGFFPLFRGWEKEYGAFALSHTHKEAVYDYIRSQQQHHSIYTLDDEYNCLLRKAGLSLYTPKE